MRKKLTVIALLAMFAAGCVSSQPVALTTCCGPPLSSAWRSNILARLTVLESAVNQFAVVDHAHGEIATGPESILLDILLTEPMVEPGPIYYQGEGSLEICVILDDGTTRSLTAEELAEWFAPCTNPGCLVDHEFHIDGKAIDFSDRSPQVIDLDQQPYEVILDITDEHWNQLSIDLR